MWTCAPKCCWASCSCRTAPAANPPHFAEAQTETLPAIRDGLLAVGAPDLEPLLAALVGASESQAVNRAQLDIELALGKAETALKPAEQDRIAATVEAVREAAALINASGTTDLVSYQKSWGLILSAQDFLDELMASKDPRRQHQGQGDGCGL